jgi:tetratricopeptide (TPR) repeat protein
VAVVCLLLAAITFTVFGRTLTHEFIDFDDETYVYDNPMVVRGLTRPGLVWAFTSVHAANWHPLTWISHMLDCQLYGLHPGGHHLTNVLLHTATVIVLFLVLRQMTGALWRSAFVAAVFAIHPLRVESVAWVAERKDVLSGLFFILTIAAYARYARRSGSFARYGLVLLLFALGLMCKPMLVTLPGVLLLLDYWPLQRMKTRKLSALVLEKLPLLALSAASCAATLLAQHKAIESTGSFTLPLRLGNALVAAMIYLGQMVWPAGLAVFYPYPSVQHWPAWEVALAGMLLAVLSWVACQLRRTQPWLLTGWLWYLVMLLPVAGIIQVGAQSHADRYTYLPQIGLYMALTWLAAKLRMNRAALGGLMAGVVGTLMACAWQQTACWKNNETLWTHTLACTTDNYVAHSSIGTILFNKGNLDEAMVHYQKALQINPGYSTGHNNLGNAFRQKGRVDEAITQYEQALQIDPDNEEFCYNLGNMLGQNGRVDEAITHFRRALEINPNFAEAENNLATALEQEGKLDEAIRHFRSALQIRPGYARAHYNLGGALLPMGRTDEAIAQLQQAVQLQPADPAILNTLAWLLAACPQASLRNGDKAVVLARKANDLTGGNNPLILHTLAAAYAEAGRFPEAVDAAQRALQLAGTQSNDALAGQLQFELTLYQAGNPFHFPQQSH